MPSISEILTGLGLAGMVLMLVVNLKVSNGNLKVSNDVNTKVSSEIKDLGSKFSQDLGNLKLDIANLKTDIAREYSQMYKQIMEIMEKTYMNKDMSREMHGSNTKRLDGFDTRFGVMEERLEGIEDLLRRSVATRN